MRCAPHPSLLRDLWGAGAVVSGPFGALAASGVARWGFEKLAGDDAWRTCLAQMRLGRAPSTGCALRAQGRRGASPADVALQSAFVATFGEVADGRLALRGEQFSVPDRIFKSLDNNAEQGPAKTLALTQQRSLRRDVSTPLL